tara:strand:+ start:2575 stop:3024 length:450 start_codon:yes stop_codon:yes gene_type:complete
MASTVTASTLTVTIKEDIDLNGQSYGSVNTLKIPSINEVSTRIMNVATGGTNVLAFAGATTKGTYHDTDVRYIRITNLDDTNYGVIDITGGGTTGVRLDPGASFSLIATSGNGVNTFIDGGGTTIANMTAIDIVANTAGIDVEVYVATI